MNDSLQLFRNASGHYGARPTIRIENDHHLDPYTFLRCAPGGDVATNKNDYVSDRDFERLYAFAKLAARKRTALFKRFRLSARTVEVSATHRGDLRVGCSLVSWDELYRIAETKEIA